MSLPATTPVQETEFKRLVIAQSIANSLVSGRPLSRRWGFPLFLIDNEDLLNDLFGAQALQLYRGMSEAQKKTMRDWYEDHGAEAAVLYGGELYEEWKDEGVAGRFDLDKLKATAAEIYAVTVENVATLLQKQQQQQQPQQKQEGDDAEDSCCNAQSEFTVDAAKLAADKQIYLDSPKALEKVLAESVKL